MYFVYFLRSESNSKKTYIGSTENLVKRLWQHNKGMSGHTKRFMPWRIEAFILADTRKTAKIAEAYFKNSSGQEKFKRFAETNPDHPNPIEGFFHEQQVGRKFGKSRFEIKNNTLIYVTACDKKSLSEKINEL